MKNGECKYHRNKALGGCSATNYMMYSRGNPQDYEEWAEQGNDGWTYNDVLPFYKKSEDFIAYPITDKQSNKSVEQKYHAQEGPLTVNLFGEDPKTVNFRKQMKIASSEYGLKFNSDYNGERQIGMTDYQVTVDNQYFRDSTAKAFLQKIPRNLQICKNSLVDKVIISSRKARGIKFSYLTMTKTVYARKKIVLSAGAFNTPGILERSGIGNPRILRKLGIKVKHALPGVGENLQDHFYLLGNMYYVDYHSEGLQNIFSESITSFGGFVDSLNYGPVPDIQFVFVGAFQSVPGRFTYFVNLNQTLVDYYTALAMKGDMLIAGVTVLRSGTSLDLNM